MSEELEKNEKGKIKGFIFYFRSVYGY